MQLPVTVFGQSEYSRDPAAHDGMDPAHASYIVMIERPSEAPMDIPLPAH
jgi:hypothetical protein